MISLLTRILRVPPQPAAPEGAEGSIIIFKPSPRYLHLRIARWVVVQISSAVGLLIALNWRTIPNAESAADSVTFGPLSLDGILSGPIFTFIEIWGVAIFLLQIPITFAVTHLDYRMRWYIVTDRSLRIREGLRTVRERTMTFANVRNLTIRQNPLQRFFGLYDLLVRSAGGGGATEEQESKIDETSDKGLHLAVFRGSVDCHALRSARWQSGRLGKQLSPLGAGAE